MNWVKTETVWFIQEEMIGLQYFPSDYSRVNAELLIVFCGGGEMRLTGDEATSLWERFNGQDEESN